MNYIENIYVCLAAPIFIAILCIHTRGRRMMMFVFGGMTVCLLSSYISTFIAAALGADAVNASLQVAPFVEEIMKLCPVLFYLLVFEPGREGLSGSVLMTAVGFATLENACYLSQNGAEHFIHLLVRGFGTGAMHVVCGAIIGIGLLYLWDKIWLQIAGTIGLLTIAITYHGIYNMLVEKPGMPAVAGYFIPLATAFFIVIPLNRRAYRKYGPS